MQEREFDKFAEEYRRLHAANIRASGETPEYFAEYKVREVARALLARGEHPRRILDFGAGVGTSVPYFRDYIPDASLTCLDVSEKCLDVGRSRFAGAAEFRGFDGRMIPFETGTFDAAFAACVFHHIDAEQQAGLLSELRRVLRPGGTLIVYEHNPLNPLTLHAVNTCPFDERATLVPAATMMRRIRSAGFARLERRFVVFFPGALRVVRPLERFLAWCPLGAQYSVFATK